MARWFGGAAPAAKSGASEEQDTHEMPAFDHRWESFDGPEGAPCRVLAAGRNTRIGDAGAETEYIFSAWGGKQLLDLRVVVPETLVEAWQSSAGQRMTEAQRLEAAKKRLRRMLAEGGPARGVVDELD